MGHISPLLGIILSFKDKYEFIYFGLENSMEEKICQKYNISFHKMKLLPFYKRNIFKNIFTVSYILKERRRIKKIYKDYDVAYIISSGGFVSIPLVLSFKNSKKLLLESNTTLGLANRFLSIFVDYVGIQFNTIKLKKSILIGNPIVIEKEEYDHLWFYKNEPLILFVGGSNGAYEIVELAYLFNKNYPDIKIFVITGERYYDSFKFNNNVVVVKSIFKLSSVLYKFKLVISRAGASTITELLLSNVDFILFPSKNVSNNHQYKNAKYLYDNNMCGIINGDNFDKDIKYVYNRFKNANDMLKEENKITIKDSIKRIGELLNI